MPVFDGESLFTPGTNVIVPGPWEQILKHEHFPGVDGVLEVRLGVAGRAIRQECTLLRQGVLARQELIAAVAAIEAYVTEGEKTLVDDFLRTFEHCSMQAVAPGPILRGGASGLTYMCRIEILYRQLAAND